MRATFRETSLSIRRVREISLNLEHTSGPLNQRLRLRVA